MITSTRYKDAPFEGRKKLSDLIRTNNPDKIPVIVEPSRGRELKINKFKFLVPNEITIARFMHEIRKHFGPGGLTRQEALFIFIGDDHVLPCVSDTMSFLYERYADPDGFLYVTYAQENTFGTFEISRKTRFLGKVKYFAK